MPEEPNIYLVEKYAESSREVLRDNIPEVELVERWKVVGRNDQPPPSVLEVRAAEGLPATGSFYPGSTEFRAVRKDATAEDDDRLLWYVDIIYQSQRFSGAAQTNPNIPPWELPPTVSYASVGTTRIFEKAYDEENELTIPVVNSAGDPFDPPLEDDVQNLVIRISRNMAFLDVDPEWVDTYQGTVNAEDVVIGDLLLPGEQGRIATFQMTLQNWVDGAGENNPYYAVSIDVERKKERQIREVIDRGFAVYETIPDTDPPEVLRFRAMESNENGERIPSSEPHLLDGEGDWVPLADYGDPDKIVYLKFKTKPVKSWLPLLPLFDVPTAAQTLTAGFPAFL